MALRNALTLRRPRSGRLEGRTTLIQRSPSRTGRLCCGLSRSSRGAGSVFSQRQPFGGEPAAIGREPLIQYVRGENAVDAEMAKVVAQLAPRADEGHVDVIGHRNRPNRPSRMTIFFVDIGNGKLAGLADGAAQLRQVDTGYRRCAALGDIKRGRELRLQRLR